MCIKELSLAVIKAKIIVKALLLFHKGSKITNSCHYPLWHLEIGVFQEVLWR